MKQSVVSVTFVLYLIYIHSIDSFTFIHLMHGLVIVSDPCSDYDIYIMGINIHITCLLQVEIITVK